MGPQRWTKRPKKSPSVAHQWCEKGVWAREDWQQWAVFQQFCRVIKTAEQQPCQEKFLAFSGPSKAPVSSTSPLYKPFLGRTLSRSPGRRRPSYRRGGAVFPGDRQLAVQVPLVKELQAKMQARRWTMHWDRLRNDLHDLEEITVRNTGKTFVIRNRTLGDAGKAIQAVGVALGPIVRLCEAKIP